MATKTGKSKIAREVYTGPLTPSEKSVHDQISNYYRKKRLYHEGKLAEKPKLPACSQQKYKDMYDK